MALRRKKQNESGEDRNVRPRLDDKEVVEEDTAGVNNSNINNSDEEEETSEREEMLLCETTYALKNVSGKADAGVSSRTPSYSIHIEVTKHYDYGLSAACIQATLYHQTTTTENETASTKKTKKAKVGFLKADLLHKSRGYFWDVADSLDQEMYDIAGMLCDNDGNFSERDGIGLSKADVKKGGLLRIYSVEIKGGGHQGNDLGLRMVHETMKYLTSDPPTPNDYPRSLQWRLAVMVPCLICYLRMEWPDDNDRIGLRLKSVRDRTEEDDEALDDAALKIMRYFSRLGFRQLGRDSEDDAKTFYLTHNQYYGKNKKNPDAAISRWISKEAAKEIDIYVVPRKTKVEEDFRSTLRNFQREPVSPEIVQLLCLASETYVSVKGANIDRADALQCACTVNTKSTKLLETLVRLGANVNAQDQNKSTALHVAAAFRRKEAVAYLIQMGADKTIRNSQGKAPFDEIQTMMNHPLVALLGGRAGAFMQGFGEDVVDPELLDLLRP